jgi:dihydroorotate dehydrogenase/Pyruvate/2-oxoacid:ferredoxin oxidoreductase delta subunit
MGRFPKISPKILIQGGFEMADLTSKYGGIKVKNPLVCASGPPTHTPEACLRAAKAGFGAVVLKTNSKEAPDTLLRTVSWPVYRFTDIHSKEEWKPVPPKKSAPKVAGRKGEMKPPYTICLISPGIILSYFLDDDYIPYANKTKELLEPYDCRVIGSIHAFTEEGWEEQCDIIKKTKVDAVELNLSCAHTIAPLSEKSMHNTIPPRTCQGALPEVAAKWTKFCVERLRIPVITKLPPQQQDPLSVALSVQRAGAVGVTFSDSSLFPSLKVDIETGQPGWHPDYPCFSSTWGPWVITFTCGNIANFRIHGFKEGLSGCGGVSSADDVIRLIMSGASTVQICRTIMAEGWDVVTGWLGSINKFMDKKGYRTVDDMRGIAADRVITDYSKLPLFRPQIMGGPKPTKRIVLNKRKCIQCGWCEPSCSHLAIHYEDGYPEHDLVKCELCGMCESVCPVGALEMKPIT